MPQVSNYIGLIPSQNASAPNFVSTVSLLAQAFVDAQACLNSITFDLDEATGVELDAIGEWVGLPRQIPGAPLSVYFSFDTAGLGFDQGQIYAPYDPINGVAEMDDATYQTMLRIKIATNSWDGTNGGLQVILALLISAGINIFSVDNQDMSMSFVLSGTLPSALMIGLLSGGYFPLKPEGVALTVEQTSVNGAPVFGFDVENQYIAGFDVGAFAIASTI